MLARPSIPVCTFLFPTRITRSLGRKTLGACACEFSGLTSDPWLLRLGSYLLNSLPNIIPTTGKAPKTGGRPLDHSSSEPDLWGGFPVSGSLRGWLGFTTHERPCPSAPDVPSWLGGQIDKIPEMHVLSLPSRRSNMTYGCSCLLFCHE